MFSEKIISIKKNKEYNNYEEFILDNIGYKDYKLFFIPNDQYNSKNNNYMSKTFTSISIIKYIQNNFDINDIYNKYLKNNLCITQCGSSIFSLILLCKKKFKFDELIESMKDSNIHNVLFNFCNFIKNNYELNDFYTENLFIKVIELKNFNIYVNYYRDFTNINNLCDFIIYTCNHYFITNNKIIPLKNNNESVILDINLENIKDGNIIKYCSQKRDNKIFSLFLMNDLRYPYNNENILSMIINFNFIKIDLDVIDKQYEYCKDKHDYFVDLL